MKRKRRVSSVAGSTYSDVTEELWSQEASQKEACNLPNSAPASPAHDNQDRRHALETHEEEEEEGELSSSDSSSSEAGTSLSSISSAEDLEDEPQTKEDTSPPPCMRIMVVPSSKHK